MTREMVTPAPAAAPTRPPPPSSTARRMKPRLDTALGGSESAGERAIVSAGRARSYHPFARDVHKKIRSPPSTGDGRSRPGAQSHLLTPKHACPRTRRRRRAGAVSARRRASAGRNGPSIDESEGTAGRARPELRRHLGPQAHALRPAEHPGGMDVAAEAGREV